MGWTLTNGSKHTSSTGLTYVEVMVSTLVFAVFTSTALQGYFAATSFRFKTRQLQAAMGAIQVDVERIRQMAQERPSAAVACDLPPSGSYAQQLLGRVAADSTVAFAPQNPSPTPLGQVTASRGQATLQATTLLPTTAQFWDYQIARTLSVNPRENALEQVLHLSYAVHKTTAAGLQSAQGTSPALHHDATAATVVQFHTVILPYATLACF